MFLFGLSTDRTAPNPTYPPLQVDHVNNILVINVLHLSTVGAGLSPPYQLRARIKVDTLQQWMKNKVAAHAAARVGINPTPARGRVMQTS